MSDPVINIPVEPPISPPGEPPVVATPEVDNDPFASIKIKYDNDINKLAGAYKNMQSVADQTAQKFAVPKEYLIKDEYKAIGESNLNSLLGTAKQGEYTQKQFDALVESIHGFQKTAQEQLATITEKRKEAIGDSKDKLLSFYTNKVPEELLNYVLENGDPAHIAILKEFREKSLKGTPTPNPGKTMTDPIVNKAETIAEKRAELINLSTQIRGASIDEQPPLEIKMRRLAKEIAELNKQP